MTNQLSKSILLALGIFSVASIAQAADISKALRTNSDVNTESENYFELGLALYSGKGPRLSTSNDSYSGAGIVANGSYSWKGFFIDAYDTRSNYLEFGYNAYDTNNWSFDVLVTPVFASTRIDSDDDRYDGIEDRKSSTMFGGRITGSFEGNILQLSLLHDVSGHSKGTTASALIGRNWQYRNWNFHSLGGFNYADSRFVNYYSGITSNEANNSGFTQFTPGARLSFTAEIGVTYPIAQDWVFRATGRYDSLIGDPSTSPLLQNDRPDAILLSTSVSYVF